MKRRRAEVKKESKESAAASLHSAEQHNGSPDLAELSKGLPSGWQVMPLHLIDILRLSLMLCIPGVVACKICISIASDPNKLTTAVITHLCILWSSVL